MSDETIKRAVDVLSKLIAVCFGCDAVSPDIDALEDGSVDIHWRTEAFEMLANVEPNGAVSYYGDSGDTTVKGAFRACTEARRG